MKFAIVFLLCGGLLGAIAVYALTPSTPNYISGGVLSGSPSWTVFVEGSNYFAKNQFGQIGYSGSNASYIVNTICLNAKRIYFAEGTFNLETYGIKLPFTNELIIEGAGRGTKLLYSGTGNAIEQKIMTMGATYRFRDFQINQTGSAGVSAGFNLQGWFYGSIETVWIYGFQYGIKLDGTSFGCYINEIRNNVIEHCTYGLYFTGGSGHTANANIAYNNRIAFCSYGIYGESGDVSCGNSFIKNDIESYTVTGIYWKGSNSEFVNNWIEQTGVLAFYLRGSGNQLLNNKYSAVSYPLTLNWTQGSAHDIFEPNIGVFESQGLLTISVTVSDGQDHAHYNLTWWTLGDWTPVFMYATPLTDLGAGVYYWLTASSTELIVHLSASATGNKIFSCMLKSYRTPST